MASRLASALILLAVVLSGCGEGAASAGATVSVYVAAPLCAGVRQALQRAGGEAGDLAVRAVCLPSVESRGRVDLALAGANSRRATEDSSAVVLLEPPGRAARFSRSIVESANLAILEPRSGAVALRDVLRALEERGSASPRSAVLDQVG